MKGNATEGIAGLQFGITYDGAPARGVDIYYWNSCTTLQFPMSNWPGGQPHSPSRHCVLLGQ